MNGEDLAQAATPEALADYVRQQRPQPQRLHTHGGGMQSIRETDYRGHSVVIRTTYSIEVDGVPLEGHMEVNNEGRVHYHAIPNYSFASAVDLVKQLIDAFPDDFGAPTAQQPHTHGG